MTCYSIPAMFAARLEAYKALTARCTRLRATKTKDATGAAKFVHTVYLVDRPCKVVAPALTPDVRGPIRLTPNVDFTFMFRVDEPPFERSERIEFDGRVFEVTSVGVLMPTSLFLKILTKEI